MRDITLGETVYFNFTTRSFSTGVPTALAGTPALSVLESNNATPITSGVSVEVDRASVTGLNQATIVATSGNGYEAGKSYAVYISTGTVGGVSVVGEVVAQFSIQASAAATDLANGTDGLGALLTTINTRLATSGYTAPLDAAGTRSAIGLASANLDTQLGDLPTNAELASSLAAADDATIAAIAALNNLSQADIRTALGMATGNLDTQLGDLPTNAELAVALAAADDAVLAQIALVKAKSDLIPAAPAAVGDIPTAVQVADAILLRDWTAIAGAVPARSALNAFRAIRNKWAVAAGVLTVTKEDDLTTAWTSVLSTDAAADPIIASDPS